MPITVTCPACKLTMSVKDNMAGRRGKCPKCNGKIDVPPINAPAPPAATPSKSTAAGLPQPTQRIPPTIRCPACQQEIGIDPGLAGQTVACPHCAHQFEMPGKAKAKPAQPRNPAPAQSDSEGDAAPSPAAPTQQPSGAGFGMSITGMVLGIVALVFSVIPWIGCFCGLLLAVLGIIFSSIGLTFSIKAAQSKGMAIAGLSTSVVALIWQPLAFFFVAAFCASICCIGPLGNMGPQPIVKKDGAVPSKQMGTLQLKFEPGQVFFNGMELFVDEKKIPQFQIALGQFSLPLPEGNHSVAIRLNGKDLFTKDVMIVPAAQAPQGTIVQVPRLENPNPGVKK